MAKNEALEDWLQTIKDQLQTASEELRVNIVDWCNARNLTYSEPSV
jgi:hypothetical protein